MASPERILVVDGNADNGALLVRCLTRRYPNCSIEMCREGEIAMQRLAVDKFDAVILHRTHDMDGTTMIRRFREIGPHMMILGVSGFDRSKEFCEAGADGFLLYDEWLLVGPLVDELLDTKRQSAV